MLACVIISGVHECKHSCAYLVHTEVRGQPCMPFLMCPFVVLRQSFTGVEVTKQASLAGTKPEGSSGLLHLSCLGFQACDPTPGFPHRLGGWNSCPSVCMEGTSPIICCPSPMLYLYCTCVWIDSPNGVKSQPSFGTPSRFLGQGGSTCNSVLEVCSWQYL